MLVDFCKLFPDEAVKFGYCSLKLSAQVPVGVETAEAWFIEGQISSEVGSHFQLIVQVILLTVTGQP